MNKKTLEHRLELASKWDAGYRKGMAAGMERATELLSKHFPLTRDNCDAIAEINQEIKELRK